MQIIILLLLISPLCFAETLILGTTSTTTNSGLMDYLLPHYTQKTGNDVKIISGGTSYILQQLENEDVDIAITHQPELEEKLLMQFPNGKRQPFMYNYFLLIGPVADPAEAKNAKSFTNALANIYKNSQRFVSRGDGSGAHVFELKLWNAAGISVDKLSHPYYIETGQDMGASILIATEMRAYMIVDQGTWAAYSKRSDLKKIYFNKNESMNAYSLLQLQSDNQLKPQAKEFADWLLEPKTLKLIDNYRINEQQGFFTE